MVLLDSDKPSVLCGAANALYNLALDSANADELLPLGALPKLCGLLEHESGDVRAAMTGVLMNVCATSETCRTELGLMRLLPELLKAIAADKPGENPEVMKNALGALRDFFIFR